MRPSLRIALPLALAGTVLGGCASLPGFHPTRCYVALDASGAPRAEACETGPRLSVRPITVTNAAFYTPPYVLGLLAYEGYINEPAEAGAAAAPPRDAAEAMAYVAEGGALAGSTIGDGAGLAAAGGPASDGPRVAALPADVGMAAGLAADRPAAGSSDPARASDAGRDATIDARIAAAAFPEADPGAASGDDTTAALLRARGGETRIDARIAAASGEMDDWTASRWSDGFDAETLTVPMIRASFARTGGLGPSLLLPFGLVPERRVDEGFAIDGELVFLRMTGSPMPSVWTFDGL